MRTVIASDLPLKLDGSWTLDGSHTLNGLVNINVLDASKTFLAQYANSPNLTTLIQTMNVEVDVGGDTDNFYDGIWNVNTAYGIGLDIWGKIVNVSRQIKLIPPADYLGYKEALPGSYPFNQAPFYAGPASSTQSYLLSDAAFRLLIMTKALANISDFSIPSINALLRYLFTGRGSCYVLDQGGMQMQYVFNFGLQPWELSVVQNPALMPHPAGVQVNILVNA